MGRAMLFSLVHYCTACVVLPAVLMFLGTGVLLTVRLGGIQFRRFGRFISILRSGGVHEKARKSSNKSVSSFRALFTAMATTIGMGNLVGPTVAVLVGGPGALFWLLFYPIIACATKYTEVLFALKTREQDANGNIIGGPFQYLNLVSPWLASWYAFITIFLFVSWSGLQANTIAEILSYEGVDHWFTGLFLAIGVFVIMLGDIQRVSSFASKLVPLMFVLYVSFSCLLLFSDIATLWAAITLVFTHALSPAAAVGGFVGASVLEAVRIGTQRMAFINECGLGSSSIAHAYADVDNFKDQAILAMYSIFADTFLCAISGLLAITTGLWTSGVFTSTVVYQAFTNFSPFYGRIVLLLTVSFFVVTTIIGNTFNASRCFAYFSEYSYLRIFYALASMIVFTGAIANMKLIWEVSDLITGLVAIPHMVGLLYLAFSRPSLLK